jgi:hypothetical protein
MRLGWSRDCGELLLFDHIRRSLNLGHPHLEGEATIAVADIIGTVGRGSDFDGCFRPRDPALAGRIDQVRRNATALDEAIDVIRVDRAYFVADGHKRVSISKANGREFIDARVSHAPTPYRLEAGVDPQAIERTSREQRFRSETGILEAVPAARFIVSEPAGYAELHESLTSYAYDMSQRLGKLLTRPEGAALWYEGVYLPTLAAARRRRLDQLIGCGTDADLFLSIHNQSQELWGSECAVAVDEAEHLVSKVMAHGVPDLSVIERVVTRARRRRPPSVLAEAAGEP